MLPKKIASALILGKIFNFFNNCLFCFQQLPIGLEFSGRMSKSGRRVFGMRKSGCLASKVDSASTLIWDVPDKWTLAEAASIPVVYGTVSLKGFS